MKTITTLVIVGVLLTIGAIAAQQPPATPPASADKPADKATNEVTDKTASVLAALKGSSPAATEPAPTNTTSSLTTVLDRYARMAAAGQQTPITSTPASPRLAPPSAAPVLLVSPGSTSSTPVLAAADTLDAIRADLRALLGRLDVLAGQDTRQ